MNTIEKILQWLLGLSIVLAFFNLIVMAADIQFVSADTKTTIWQLAGLSFIISVIGNIVMVCFEKD